MDRPRIIVVGASGGGIEALKTVASELSENLNAVILVVQHIAPQSPSFLPEILSRSGPLPAKRAGHGETICPGNIYVAPPDQHLLVRQDQLELTRGPRENRSRPAIDPLFRSAAAVHGSRVIGVILSGSLDDGTAGLLAVKRGGGLAVVQEPSDATHPGMPENALQFVDVDHTVPTREMGRLLNDLVKRPVASAQHVPEEILREAAVELGDRSTIECSKKLGQLVPLSCPECGGPLWEIDGEPISRFRCHTGHAFSGQSLVTEMSEATERALWAALRIMDERSRMLQRLADQHNERGHRQSANQFTRQAEESRCYAEQLRDLLPGHS